MWPWTHAAVGYIIYSLLSRERDSYPEENAVIMLGIATQVPDLIDKTFAWVIPVLPGGRSLAHTLFVAVPVVALMLRYNDRRGRHSSGIAFGIGYLSHLLGDGFATVVTESISKTSFLLWPLLSLPTWDTAASVSAHVSAFAVTPWFLFEIGLTGVGILLWASDGFVGLGRIYRFSVERIVQAK